MRVLFEAAFASTHGSVDSGVSAETFGFEQPFIDRSTERISIDIQHKHGSAVVYCGLCFPCLEIRGARVVNAAEIRSTLAAGFLSY